jgi:hypothetical protein
MTLESDLFMQMLVSSLSTWPLSCTDSHNVPIL